MVDLAANWSRKLENVLQDRTALDTFRSWLLEQNAAQGLDLHFAIRGYMNMVSENNPMASDLARQIHQTFISPRTGTAFFIPPEIRKEFSTRIRQFVPDIKFFDPIKDIVEDFLRKQFTTTDEFVALLNSMALCDSGPSMSVSMFEPRGISAGRSQLPHSHNGTQKRNKAKKSPGLTAYALARSMHHRGAQLGASSVERMYPGPRMPYTCHATTSQHDSAVSSSFSSDANKSLRLSSIREEQRRGNPFTFTVPRVERSHHFRDDSKQFDHETNDGRLAFHAYLCRKLNKEIQKRRRNENLDRQIEQIDLGKDRARDIISSKDCEPMMDGDDDDIEDDVERYVEAMHGDGSAPRSTARTPRPPMPPNGFASRADDVPSPRRSFSKSRGAFLEGYIIDPIDSLPPRVLLPTMHNFSGRFAPPPNSGFNTCSRDKFGSAKSEGVYNPESGIGSSLFSASQGEDRKSARLNTIKISYKGLDGVPVLAQVPLGDRPLTLREFRKHFCLSNKGVQFFFVTACEDNSAAYQLLRINDDAAFLPVFEGRISAEIKSTSPE